MQKACWHSRPGTWAKAWVASNPCLPSTMTSLPVRAHAPELTGSALLIIALALMPGMSAFAAERSTMTVTSPAFAEGQPIPQQYTCEGDNISPALDWQNLPARTKSLALIVDDPDAPDPAAPRMTWVHWVLFDIPPAASGLASHVSETGLPKGAAAGTNSWGKDAYGGPCPPIGRHRYFFKLYALDKKLEFATSPTKTALLSAMKGHVIGQASLMGTYRKLH